MTKKDLDELRFLLILAKMKQNEQASKAKA